MSPIGLVLVGIVMVFGVGVQWRMYVKDYDNSFQPFDEYFWHSFDYKDAYDWGQVPRRVRGALLAALAIFLGSIVYGSLAVGTQSDPMLVGGDDVANLAGRALGFGGLLVLKSYLAGITFALTIAGALFFLIEFQELRLIPVFSESVSWWLGRSGTGLQWIYTLFWVIYGGVLTADEVLENGLPELFST